MIDEQLSAIRELIQVDVGKRGLRTDPADNLITATVDDFAAACRSIAGTPDAAVGVVTGFFIPTSDPPAGETDGPLGALFLARALTPLGIRVVLITDVFCASALSAGVGMAGLRKVVPVVTLPTHQKSLSLTAEAYWEGVRERTGPLTHLIALERAGPSHTAETLAAQTNSSAISGRFCEETTPEDHDRCHTMRGLDITAKMSPAHQLFDNPARHAAGIVTIGIGDGGNEIGMGKIPWDVIARNIPNGGRVACRVATDQLIVCGVSNWGAYGLGSGVRLLRGAEPDFDLLDIPQEQRLLECMVQRGPLVDGRTGQETATVDGLSWEHYTEPLRRLRMLFGGSDPRPEPLPIPESVFEVPSIALATSALAAPTAGAEVRTRCRSGEQSGVTAGQALGFVQANLVVVPRELAFDFLLFCQRNPKPCPLLDVTEPGSAEPKFVARGADLRTDLPRYRIYRDGELVDEPTDLSHWWRDDLVGFLLGCSFTFENALLQAGLPVRHLEARCNVPMYRTNIQCRPAGAFRGPMVVSMRPMTPAQALTATRVCSRFPRAHGAPVHFGDPAAIGITDLAHPDFGDAVEVRPGEVPVFWACGVTPQAVAMECRPPLLITHKPGHMFVTDSRDTDLEGE